MPDAATAAATDKVDPTLSDEQIASFHEHGFLIIPAAFDAGEVLKMQAEADFILELVINASLAHEHIFGRLDIRELADGTHMVRKIQPINDLSKGLAAVSADNRLLAPMAQLMSDEPVLMEEKLNYKQPLLTHVAGIDARQIDDRFPVHSDWAYYKAQNYPQSIISSAISMDPCLSNSGPLRVWPGSHKVDREHEAMNNGLQVKPGLIDFDGGQEVLAPAGSVMFFHSLLIHNSMANVSGKPRRLMIYSHYPKAANMGFDIRNGPGRLHTSPLLWDYVRMRQSGAYVDQFKAPVYS